jgi:hypothetical protein
MPKVHGSSPQSDTLGIAEDFIVNKWRCKVRRGERGYFEQNRKNFVRVKISFNSRK